MTNINDYIDAVCTNEQICSTCLRIADHDTDECFKESAFDRIESELAEEYAYDM